MYNLTERQKEALRWLVAHIEAGILEPEFQVMWHSDEAAKIWHRGKGESAVFLEGPLLTRATVDALAAEGLLLKKDSPTDIARCTVTVQGFHAVHRIFVDTVPRQKSVDEVTAPFLAHIHTTLGVTVQALNSASWLDRGMQDRYTQLLGQLKDELTSVPFEHFEAAEAAAESAQEFIAVVTRQRLNSRRRAIVAEGLKRSAETLEHVVPKAMQTVLLIIAMSAEDT